ncbi:MAG: hypothetical protein ACWGNO_03115, partial [Desulfobacterales bacterium]
IGDQLADTVDYRVRRIDTTPGVYLSDGTLAGLRGKDVATITIRPDVSLPHIRPRPRYSFF